MKCILCRWTTNSTFSRDYYIGPVTSCRKTIVLKFQIKSSFFYRSFSSIPLSMTMEFTYSFINESVILKHHKVFMIFESWWWLWWFVDCSILVLIPLMGFAVWRMHSFLSDLHTNIWYCVIWRERFQKHKLVHWEYLMDMGIQS